MSIAAGEHAPRPIALALSAVAVGLFVALLVALAITVASPGKTTRASVDRPGLDPTLRWFTFVAACAVLAARFDTSRPLDWLLGTAAAAAWLALIALATRSAHHAHRRSPTELRDQARGAWLLASVATSGLAIVAATLAVATHHSGLVAIATLAWLLAISMYVVIGWLIIWRAVATPLHPQTFQPDTWILMGALAIATLAGDHVLAAAEAIASPEWTRSLADWAGPVTIATWTLACLWIAPLMAHHAWCVLRHPAARRFANVWWAGVFPLGMFAVATQATARRVQLRTLTTVAVSFSWLAIAAWLFVAASGLRLAAGAFCRGPATDPPAARTVTDDG